MLNEAQETEGGCAGASRLRKETDGSVTRRGAGQRFVRGFGGHGLDAGCGLLGKEDTVDETAEDAAELAPGWRRSRPAVVVVDAAVTGSPRSWATHLIASLRPTAVWGVVESTAKTEDIHAWAEALGGIDALALENLEATVSPASALAVGIPVARIDGQPATAARWVAAIVDRPDITVREARSGPAVMAQVAESLPDLVVVDLQMGNMGGMAVCLELRLEESYGNLDPVPVLMLLDRRPDVFMARRSGAEGWVVKPLDPIRLRRAITSLLDGGTYYDESYQPLSVVSTSASNGA